MSTVWTVLEVEEHKGESLVGVFSTKELAEKAADHEAQRNHCYDYCVDAWELDGFFR